MMGLLYYSINSDAIDLYGGMMQCDYQTAKRQLTTCIISGMPFNLLIKLAKVNYHISNWNKFNW